MSQVERDRTEARKAAKKAEEARSGKTARDAAAKAVLDNMARLKALRLASQGTEPEPAAPAGKPSRNRAAKPLTAWLSSQQSGGRRT